MDAKQLRDGGFVDITVGVFKMISESWAAFKVNWQVFVIALGAFLGTIFIGVFTAVLLVGNSVASDSSELSSSDFGSALAVFAITYFLVLLLIVFIAPLVITAQLASARGKKHSFGEFFKASKSRILGFVGLSLLSGLAILAGLILLIIPGLLVAFFLTFASYIYMDRQIGVVDSMKASYELVKEYWKVTVALILVNVALSMLSYITFIGAIASVVLSIAYFCLSAVIYVRITGRKSAAVEATVVKQKTTASPAAK